MTLYADLGLSPDATPEEIKRAHRRGMRQHHPDKPGGDRAKFERVQKAFDVLSIPDRRARYDATGDEGGGPDNAAAHVMELIVQALDASMTAIADGVPVGTIDLLTMMRGHLAGLKRQLTDQMRQAKGLQKRMVEVRKRMSRKGKDLNIIAKVMDDRIAQMKIGDADAARKVELIDKAVETLKDYEWARDVQDPLGAAQQQAIFLQGIGASASTFR